jgi:hypothetical protein
MERPGTLTLAGGRSVRTAQVDDPADVRDGRTRRSETERGEFTSDLYWVVCTLAGDARRGYLPHWVNLLAAEPRFPHVRKAAYFVIDRSGNVAYVGKVCRPSDITAVGSRLVEHVQDVAKAMTWAKLFVIPLKVDTPNVVVESIEEVVGERLEPYQNRRLPRRARLASAIEALLGGTE